MKLILPVLAIVLRCGTAMFAQQSPGIPKAEGLMAPIVDVANSIMISAVGDVMMGSTFPDDTRLPPNDGKELLRAFTPILSAGDIVFGNLEGPMLDGGVSTKCPPQKPAADGTPAKVNCYAFRVPTSYGQNLKDAGFTVMSVANNHAGDFGDQGRASTRETLDDLGIHYAGSDREKFATTIFEVKGLRVGFAGFAHNDVVPNVNDLAAARELVAGLKKKVDLVVVSFHGGAEGVTHQHVFPGTEMFYGEPRGDLRAFAHTVIDAGADLVLGHGPHVLRGMEVYKGHLVVYSMGNFCTYGWFNLKAETTLSAVFHIHLAADGRFMDGTMISGKQIEPGGPVLDPSGEAIRVVRQLSIADFGPSAPLINDDGTFKPADVATPGGTIMP